MEQPGAFASMCGCAGPACADPACRPLTPAAGSVRDVEPEPEPEPPAPGTIVEKRGMLTREEAEEMAEDTAKDIAAAKAEAAAERQRGLEAEAAKAQADAAALGSALEGLDAFAAEQLRRVAAYRQLDGALRVLLQRGDLFKYQKTCSIITTDFANCSQRIMAIGANLRSRLPGGAGAAAIIDAIQSCEERKLQLTVALQVRRRRRPLMVSPTRLPAVELAPSCLSPRVLDCMSWPSRTSSCTKHRHRSQCLTCCTPWTTAAKVAATLSRMRRWKRPSRPSPTRSRRQASPPCARFVAMLPRCVALTWRGTNENASAMCCCFRWSRRSTRSLMSCDTRKLSC